MAIYELRTYVFYVGKIGEAIEVYQNLGWPALERLHGGRLVGYFLGDIGAMNQIVHFWKFTDDADRRQFWQTAFADKDFQAFGKKIRPLIKTQENKLLLASLWGPHP
ncbi:MAG: NIPSNAP family protein [Geminicoccales bacterium]